MLKLDTPVQERTGELKVTTVVLRTSTEFCQRAHWNCAVFGIAAFFDREIPPAWPTGILWNTSSASVKSFKYADNQLRYLSCDVFDFQPEAVRCYDYLLHEQQDQ